MKKTVGEKVAKKFQQQGHAYYDELIDLVNDACASEHEALLDAIQEAYDHLDLWGVVSGGSEREHKSQQRIFNLLRPFVK